MKKNKSFFNLKAAFTLVEMLAVVAIISILAGILVVSAGIAEDARKKAESKALFRGWINALEQYKATYGYYPNLFAGGSLELSSGTNQADFEGTLDGSDTARNRRGISFYTFTEADYDTSDPRNLADAFDNPDIFIVVDVDRDGTILPADFPADPDQPANLPAAGIKASILIYTLEDAAEGYQEILSWQ